DTIVIIGGGATSDIGGLAAALLLRGVNWIVVPTTLLSMVDAAIGGKVAVNTTLGKNLIGSFHSPTKALYFDEFLETLPEEEMQSGLGEVLKYAFLDKNIANYILETDNLLKSNFISLCAKYKTKITQLDFKEADQRKILNLGHTYGHAIETHLHLPHGQAVAYGLWIIIELYAKEYRDEFERFIAKLGINLPPIQIDKQKIIELLRFDKKRDKANTIDIIIPTDMGPEIKQVSMNSLEDKFNEIKFSRYIK
ncbi:MAG: 3-dehydroquinate synthase, partial [Ignavibacteriae bacterium]|nr:3-dehydroquinate synthase [Ignavibacteriota bacterium]